MSSICASTESLFESIVDLDVVLDREEVVFEKFCAEKYDHFANILLRKTSLQHAVTQNSVFAKSNSAGTEIRLVTTTSGKQ